MQRAWISVIPPSQGKGMDYKEYTEAKRGTSWKQKLRQTIDRMVITAKDWDEFLKLMQEAGYEIKPGKYISFRAEGTRTVYSCKDHRRKLYRRKAQGAHRRDAIPANSGCRLKEKEFPSSLTFRTASRRKKAKDTRIGRRSTVPIMGQGKV